MTFSPTSNDEASHFLRSRSIAPLHISGNKHEGNHDEIIALSRMNAVLFYEPEEMIISVQAGIGLHDLEQLLAEEGQWIPTLAASESLEYTLGAAIAMDHFHPRSLQWGALRTTILGGTFCTTKGEIYRSGSRVVKSVAGYDIHRAFCGSKGLFGIILDLTLKVQPLPERLYRFFATTDRKEILRSFRASCLDQYSGRLLVELAGYGEDIKNDIERFDSLGIQHQQLDEPTWEGAVQDLIRIQDLKRVRELSPEVAALLDQVRRVFDPEGVLI